MTSLRLPRLGLAHALFFSLLAMAKPETGGDKSANASFRFISFAETTNLWMAAKPNKYVTVQTPSCYFLGIACPGEL